VVALWVGHLTVDET